MLRDRSTTAPTTEVADKRFLGKRSEIPVVAFKGEG